MKCYFKKILKLGILSIGLSLFLYNCQKNEEIVHQEFQQNGAFSKISFDEFKSKTNLNNEFESFSRFFDINKPASKASFNKKSSGNFDDAIILTGNIIRIKKDDFSTYTFTILTQTENYEFYNLVLYVDNNQEIYKSHILKYTPSGKWLADTTKHFSGNVKIINNDIFNVDNLLQSKSSLSSKSILLEEECIDDVIISYECSNRVKGHREGNPGPEGGCFADEFYVYINILPIPCDGSGDNGDFDPETGGGEGGTTSGGGDDDIVTAPNTEPDAWKIKNFESGTLNTEERNYYNSDPDIKGTIDNYLKLKNFSYTPKQEAKASLKFGESLKLNFEQFKWTFENRDSEDMSDIKDYLNEIINVTSEIEKFIKEVINAEIETNNNAEVNFEDQIINELTGKALCIYEKLKSSSTGFKNAIKKFDGGFPVSHLSFKINNTLPSGNYGRTSPPNNFNTTVVFSNTQLSNISDLGGAIAFAHEMIHAEIFRKMLSAAQKGDLDPANMTQQEQVTYVNSLRNNFPGIYDYYIERYKPTWNHNQMASHYRGTIADIIEEFDNSSKSRQIYEDLSWVGLRILGNGVTSIAWDGLTQSQKDRVLSNFNTHFFNGTSNCN